MNSDEEAVSIGRVCWLVNRSLDMPIGLLYPWDSLLLEAGALAVLLPVQPHLLPRHLSTPFLPLERPKRLLRAHPLERLNRLLEMQKRCREELGHELGTPYRTFIPFKVSSGKSEENPKVR